MDAEQLQRMTELRQRLKQDLGERYDEPIRKASALQLERGSVIYARVCAPCHGARGTVKGEVAEGIVGNPTDFTDPGQARFFSEQARLHIIRKGVKGTPMMGWENVLAEDDIVSVYLYIRSLIQNQ